MCVTYLLQFKKIICSPFSRKVYFFKKRFNKIKTIYPTFVHFKLFVTFHGNETFLVGRIFFDEIKMAKGFWVSKNINQFCSPILHYKDPSICVHCMWLAQSSGWQGWLCGEACWRPLLWEFQKPMGVATSSRQAHAF